MRLIEKVLSWKAFVLANYFVVFGFILVPTMWTIDLRY